MFNYPRIFCPDINFLETNNVVICYQTVFALCYTSIIPGRELYSSWYNAFRHLLALITQAICGLVKVAMISSANDDTDIAA